MNSKKKIITKFVDEIDSNFVIPEDLRAQAENHKQISSLLKSAYKCDFTSGKVEFLEQRVMAHVSEMEKPGFCERIADTFGFFFCKKKSVVLGLTATAIIAIIAFSTFYNKTAIAQAPEYESFVIYETEAGDGFVQYFNYNVENENEN